MNRSVLTAAAILIVVGALGSTAFANEKNYIFGTNEARTNISFVGEAEIETIVGFTNKLVGSIKLSSSAMSGKTLLEAKVEHLDTGIALRDEHLRSESWLDAAKHPSIKLELSKVSQGKDGKTWDFEGTLSIKGSSKAVSGQAKLKFVTEEQAKKFGLGDGDWVNVKTSIELKLSDFGIKVPEGVGAKVSDKWRIDVDIWGSTAAPK